MTRRRGPAAVLVTVLVLGACSGNGGDGDPGSGEPGGGRTGVQSVTSARPLLSALLDESAATEIGILGLEEALEMPAGDLAEMRRRTDEAVARLRGTEPGSGAQGGAGPYQATYEAVGGLAALRGDVDGHTAPGSLNELSFAADVNRRYAAVLDALLDDLAGAAVAAPEDIWVGAQLYVEGLRQVVLVPRLRFALVQGAIGSTGDPAWAAETSRLAGAVAQGRGAVAGLASGTPYEEAASRLEAELDASGADQVVDDAMGAGQYELDAIVQSLELHRGEGWLAFVDRVEDSLLSRAPAGP